MTNVSEEMKTNFRSTNASEIGAILASSRRSKNISLQELADNLRIPKMYLRSLENSDFESLPGVAYVPGYIRSYCKFIGIDSSALVAAYIASVDNDDVNPIYEVPGQALVPKFSNSAIAMIAVFITIFGYIGWLVLLREEPEQIASIPPMLEQIPNVEDSISEVSLDLENSEINKKNDLVETNLVEKMSLDKTIAEKPQIDLNDQNQLLDSEIETREKLVENKKETQKEDVVVERKAQTAKVEDSESSKDEMKLSDSQNEIAVDKKVQNSNPSSAVAKGIELSDTLTIKAVSSAWIEMVNSDGDVITSKLLRSGDSIAASLADNLYLTTGNAGALMFEMIDVPAFKIGKTGEIVRDLPLRADSIISRKFD